MKITYDSNGVWTTTHDGQTIAPSSLSPTPQAQDWSTLKEQYTQRGAVIYSSLWEGWVPLSDCGTSGDLGSSSFTVSNLRIQGTVVQGPKPSLCPGSTPSNPPSPPPPPPVSPPPPASPPPSNICTGVSGAFDPTSTGWVEVNAPQNVQLYVVCTNSGTNMYLSCSFAYGIKWQCPTNGQICQPDSQSGRYAVVNNQWCRLNTYIPHATGEEGATDAVIDETYEIANAVVSQDTAPSDTAQSSPANTVPLFAVVTIVLSAIILVVLLVIIVVLYLRKL